jgi:hypothetical protein
MIVMKKDFETHFTGWAFILEAVWLWFGWVLSPHHIGEYIVATDFSEVGKSVWYWIWMYRIHIFGWVTMGIAIFALMSITLNKPCRVVILPGAGMIIVGTFTLAIASAYYYNFGAWGVGKTAGMSAIELKEFINDLLFTNQYVTCFLRFGRIFSGVGLVLLGYAFLKWRMLSVWLGWFTTLLGLVAMGIILVIPDNFEIYNPVFHVKVVWLLAMGIVLLRQGVYLPKAEF